MYVLLLDQLERWVMAERQVSAVLLAAGAEVEMPTLGEARERFDEALDAPFERVDLEQLRLREAVGLRGR